MQQQRKRVLCAVLSLLLALTAAGCASAPDAGVTPQPSGPAPETGTIELVTSASTPEPTATPVPDPLLGAWANGACGLSITFTEGGSFEAAYGGKTAGGAYTRADDRLTLTPSGGSPVDLTLSLQDDTLLLDGTLALSRADGGAQGSGTEEAGTIVRTSFCAENADFSVRVRGAVVTIEMHNGVIAADCCFTSIDHQPEAESPDWMAVNQDVFSIFKSDGAYVLWVRDAAGTVLTPQPVTVDSGFRYVIRAEGLKALQEPMAGFLEANGSSVDAINAAISRDVAAAGLYTRCGVVTAGVSLVSRMAGWGASVVYQGHGSYQKEDDWGVNPDWGARLSQPTKDGNGTYYYTGMQCVASIVWAYKQAGMNLSNGAGSAIGTLGEWEKRGDNRIGYDHAKSGDIVQNGGHYLMIVDRLDTDGDGADDAYLTYEMNAPHLAFLVLTFRQVRYRSFFSMDAVFENTGRLRSKSRIWEDTYRIPFDALPEYLRQATEAEDAGRSLDALLTALGL